MEQELRNFPKLRHRWSRKSWLVDLWTVDSRSGRGDIENAVDPELLEEPPVLRVHSAPNKQVLKDASWPLFIAGAAHDLPAHSARLYTQQLL